MFCKTFVPIYVLSSQCVSLIVRLCSRHCWCPTHILWHSKLSCMIKSGAFNSKHLQLFSWQLFSWGFFFFFFKTARIHVGPQWSCLEGNAKHPKVNHLSTYFWKFPLTNPHQSSLNNTFLTFFSSFSDCLY